MPTAAPPNFTPSGVDVATHDIDGPSRQTKVLTVAGLLMIAAIFVFVLLSQLLSSIHLFDGKPPLLFLGEDAKTDHQRIPLRLPVDLTNKTADEILTLRNQRFRNLEDLISEEYKPNSRLWKSVQPTKWLSVYGKLGLTSPSATSGSSNASRMVLNPLLLASAHIYPTDPSFSPIAFSDTLLASVSKETPLSCEPKSLTWQPADRRAFVVYDVGDYLANRRKKDRNHIGLSSCAAVDFNLFNARDMGLRYCFTSPNLAENIELLQPLNGPVKLVDSLEASNDHLKLTSSLAPYGFRLNGNFPASIDLLFYRKKPDPQTEPDLRFRVQFERNSEISEASRLYVDSVLSSLDALCISAVALSDLGQNEHDASARQRALQASRWLETLHHQREKLPPLDAHDKREIQRYINGSELKSGYAFFLRSSSVLTKLKSNPAHAQLVAEYAKPHWSVLRALR